MLRNTIYNFNIRILGMGLPINNLVPDVNIDDLLTIVPWEEQNIDVDDTYKFFNIDHTLLEFQYMAETQKVNLATDVTDWKLVERGANNTLGATILTAADAGGSKTHVVDGIEYSLTGTAANAALVAKKLRDVEPTITAQRFYFVARNLKVPFTVTYDNGFIPNSVLIAEHWPADRLPKTGLQLAKTGNVLPSGTSKTEDPEIQWSTEIEVTGIIDGKLGAGKGNYAQLNALDAVKYPLGQACKDLGPEWYVPSLDELHRCICPNKSTFGVSYTFYEYIYWSTTEEANSGFGSHSDVVYFNDGYRGARYKSNPHLVRCVREI